MHRRRTLRGRAATAGALLAVVVAFGAFGLPWLSARFTQSALDDPPHAASDLRWAKRLDPLTVDPYLAAATLAPGSEEAVAALRKAVSKQPAGLVPALSPRALGVGGRQTGRGQGGTPGGAQTRSTEHDRERGARARVLEPLGQVLEVGLRQRRIESRAPSQEAQRAADVVREDAVLERCEDGEIGKAAEENRGDRRVHEQPHGHGGRGARDDGAAEHAEPVEALARARGVHEQRHRHERLRDGRPQGGAVQRRARG